MQVRFRWFSVDRCGCCAPNSGVRPRQKLVSILLFSAAPLLPACVTEPDAGAQAPTALLDLRQELGDTPPAEALSTKLVHFAPLCDADGYPLVGNVASKGLGLQPSEYCAEAKKLEQLD